MTNPHLSLYPTAANLTDDTFGGLSRHFYRTFGPKTEKILGLVKEPQKDRHFSWDDVEPGLKQRVYDAFEDMQSRARASFD